MLLSRSWLSQQFLWYDTKAQATINSVSSKVKIFCAWNTITEKKLRELKKIILNYIAKRRLISRIYAKEMNTHFSKDIHISSKTCNSQYIWKDAQHQGIQSKSSRSLFVSTRKTIFKKTCPALASILSG